MLIFFCTHVGQSFSTGQYVTNSSRPYGVDLSAQGRGSMRELDAEDAKAKNKKMLRNEFGQKFAAAALPQSPVPLARRD